MGEHIAVMNEWWRVGRMRPGVFALLPKTITPPMAA
jgi:hypothetical protein